jgi:ribokinase
MGQHGGESASRPRPRVTVLGSLNTDISLAVPHLPGPGETVLAAGPAVTGPGGKGANQAVAAARLGAAVRMVGCCGDDEFGARLRAGLAAEGIDVSGIRTVPGAASGLALITVAAGGENAIAVAPGANMLAGPAEVAAVFAAPADVLVVSAEIPEPVLAQALAQARGRLVATVVNLAPVPPGAARLLAAGPDWLVVNEQEAAVLLGEPAGGAAAAAPGGAAAAAPGGAAAAAQAATRQAALAAAVRLAARGPRQVVITLGAAGAVVAGQAGSACLPGFAVDSVDSVGAGDAFVGALAVLAGSGAGAAEAVRHACAAGAAATTRRGAQAALPGPAEVLAATGLPWPIPR